MREKLVWVVALMLLQDLSCSNGSTDRRLTIQDDKSISDGGDSAQTTHPDSGKDGSDRTTVDTGFLPNDTGTGTSSSGTESDPSHGDDSGSEPPSASGTEPGDTNLDDKDSDGSFAALDCNDSDGTIHPGADEIPGNSKDDNCNKAIDEMLDTGATCAEAPMPIVARPARLMILQDISSSIGAGGPASNWNKAKAALKAMLENPANFDIEFGFDIFPVDGDCGVATHVLQDTALNNASTIVAQLDAISPKGFTPLCSALHNFAAIADYAPAFNAKGANRYLLLVSDGANMWCDNYAIGCGKDAQTPVSPEDLAAKTAALLGQGINTMAIGFGQYTDPVELNAIAGAGGTSFTTFIQANDQAQLQTALDSMAQAVVSCTWSPAPTSGTADPDLINVSFDNVKLKLNQDCTSGDGWTWSDQTKTSLNFCPDSCNQLKASPTIQVMATYGCPADAT